MMWSRQFVGCLTKNINKNKELYVRNLFRLNKNKYSASLGRGIYIRRYGWLGSARRVGVGQDREVVE